jgi:hypothetical protein
VTLRILPLLFYAAVADGQVVINEIHFAPPDKKPLEFVELFNAGAQPVPLAGWRLDKFAFPAGATLPAGGYLVVAPEPDAVARAFGVQPLGPFPGRLSNEGEKLTLRDARGRVIDAVTYGVGFPWPTATAGGGASLQRVGGQWVGETPTPGAENRGRASHAAFADVVHTPAQPRSGEAITISARFTGEPGEVTLAWQAIAPGAYVRKTDPDYEKLWQEVPMTGGRGMFSAQIPAQPHRTLVRYRILADGGKVRAPLPDDPCPNFACFVSDGPAAYTGALVPGKTPPITFPPDFLSTLPTFTLLARSKDVQRSQYDGGHNHQPQLGTFVFEGRVYDHITFKNRGAASTYVAGKNKWGFDFLPTHGLPLTPGGEHWKGFALNACASPWVQVNRGMAGLDEAVAFHCYRLAGVPAAGTLPVALRVITTRDEQPSQYEGDLWGLYLVVEQPNGAWLKNHGWPDGLTYKPEDGPKFIPAGYPRDPRAAWEEFQRGPRGDAEAWWRRHLDVPSYVSFHALNAFTGNVDLRPGANHAFYQHPQRGWMPVPWDLDMMFIPRTHQPGYIDQARCLEVPAIALEYRNRARELLDLLASDGTPQGGQIGQVIAEYAAKIAPGGRFDWALLDAVRWNHAPQTADKGAFFRTPYEQGMGGGSFRRVLSPPDFTGFQNYIRDFCTDTRAEKNYALNDGDPVGHGYGRLLRESHDPDIPERPVLSFQGGQFHVSAFADPQGADTFAAMEWRLAAVGGGRFELSAVWSSGEGPAARALTLPAGVLQPGLHYRARVRWKDNTGRWSRWSAAVAL